MTVDVVPQINHYVLLIKGDESVSVHFNYEVSMLSLKLERCRFYNTGSLFIVVCLAKNSMLNPVNLDVKKSTELRNLTLVNIVGAKIHLIFMHGIYFY